MEATSPCGSNGTRPTAAAPAVAGAGMDASHCRPGALVVVPTVKLAVL